MTHDSDHPTRDTSQDDPPESEQTTRTSHTTSSEQDRIGPYRILEQVGSGGMGEVYRAEQTEPIRRTVALKIIKRGMDTKEVITRFEAERQALALMDHPNIAKVFDAGSTPRGRPYFAMEYVKGVPITKYCDEHKLALRKRLELFIQLCEGVQHAHQKAIIHRDLKPSNVLVTIQDDKPVPKIIDFGVAKATAQKLTEKTMYTALGEMIGTPEYMSPEQAALTGEDIDTRTDVYALGVILYELLAGALPFDPTELRKAGFEGIIRMLREQDPPRPSTRASTLGDHAASVAKARRTIPGRLVSRLRGDLDWITMRALEKDRTRRYGSPSELAADVRRHLRSEPVLASPPSAAYRTRKFVRRHTLSVGVAATGVVVVLGFAVTMTVQANRIARERDRADQEAETSDRVSEFLVSVFNVSDPGEARGNSITAREVLDNGALRIQRELKDQPLLRAKMMDAMGRVYQNLGLLTMAESLLIAALRLREQQLGEEHLDTVESLSQLGRLYAQLGKPDEARSILERALDVRQRKLGEEHVDAAWSLYYLASSQVNSEGSRELLERALHIFERELGPDHQAVAWCLTDLGGSCRGDAVCALPYLRRALAIKERTLGPDHYDVGEAHHQVGRMLLGLGRLDEAKAHLETACAILEKSLGPNHYRLSAALDTLGDLLRRLGDYEGARSNLERSLRILEASGVAPEHYAFPIILHNLAQLAKDTGAYAKADSLFRRSLQVAETAELTGHFILPSSLRNLAQLAEHSGAYTEADSLLRRAVESGERIYAHERLWGEHAETLELYATFLRDMGRAGEAVTMEARAKAIREKLKQSSQAN